MKILETDSSEKALDWLQAFIGWLALVITLLSALALGGYRPVTWTFLAFGVAVLFTIQIVRDFIAPNRNRLILVTLASLLYFMALLWGIVQTFGNMPVDLAHPAWSRVVGGLNTISADPTQGHHSIMRLMTYGMLFWIAFRTAADAGRAGRFLKVIALFSSALALYGIYALFTGSNPILDREGPTRIVNASFVNRNSYATYAVFGFLANLACYLNRSDRDMFAESFFQRLRNTLESFFSGSWIFALGALICLTALVLTQSRAGAGAGLIAVLVFFFSYRMRGAGNGVTLGITLVAILSFVVFTSTSGLTERLLMDPDEDGRFAVYPHVIEGIEDRPLLGHGLGAFHDTFRARVPEAAAMGEWHLAHNSYLENIYELGIPAAAALYLALMLLVLRIWQGTRERQRNRVYSSVALAAALAAGFHSVFDFSLQMPAVAGLFAILLGMGCAQSVSARRKKRRRKPA